MNEEQLKCLLDSAALAKIKPSTLKPVNPFTQTGEKAQAMQMAVQTLFPQMAAQWRTEAGESISLEAAAAKAGLREITNNIHQELSNLDADYIAGAEEAAARREADLLASLEKGAAELAETREKQQRQFSQQAGKNNSSGQYTRDFMRRLGAQTPAQLKSMSTKRIIGG